MNKKHCGGCLCKQNVYSCSPNGILLNFDLDFDFIKIFIDLEVLPDQSNF